MWNDNPAEDGLLHERVKELPEKIEGGEEKSTHCSGLLIDGRKYKLRDMPSETRTEELDCIEGCIQGHQAEPANEKCLVEVPGVKTDRTDRFSGRPEIHES